MELKFTIFTPTYNRAYTLTRLYESLKVQSYKSFEWLIVDDGSTDNTESLIKSFIDEKPFFNIKYIKTVNGGKHRAINKGLPYAKGKLFFIVDSDDCLVDYSLEKIFYVESSIKDEDKKFFAGVCGNKGYFSGKTVGTTQNTNEYIDVTMSKRSSFGISGDKAEVFYTEILIKYPFPEFDGETFLTESIIWDRISNDGFRLRYFNEIIYLCEYLFDGLTKSGFVLYAKNPKQWGLDIFQKKKFKIRSGRNTSLETYKYYLYLKHDYSMRKIATYLKINVLLLIVVVAKNSVIDFFRTILHGNSIRKQIKKDLAHANT